MTWELTHSCGAGAASIPKPHLGIMSCGDFSPPPEVWRDRPGDHWCQKAPGRSRETQAGLEPAATPGLGGCLAETPTRTIPYWVLQQGLHRPDFRCTMGHFHCHLHHLLYNLKKQGNTQPIFLPQTRQLWSMHVVHQFLLSILAEACNWDRHRDIPSTEREVPMQIQHLPCH